MPGPQSAKKRAREASRQDHQREKAQKRQERKATKAPRTAGEGEDPDLIGIVPGPQPQPAEDEW
jgi:hypothetical protein